MALKTGSLFHISKVYVRKLCLIKQCKGTRCAQFSTTVNHHNTGNKQNRTVINGPGLKHFIAKSASAKVSSPDVSDDNLLVDDKHYIDKSEYDGQGRKVFIETYGCQMNVNDIEIAHSILKDNGFIQAETVEQSDVVLVMTCAVREGAEEKIWNRLEYLKYLKRKRSKIKSKPQMKIGVIGCMAERLKTKILEKDKLVDIVCGPDAYRDLPRLLTITDSGQTAVNVLLSLEETYADIMPVRLSPNSPSAFVSIMRGCDNMCSYCIVPFTRGRERSRPVSSILNEVRCLAAQGIKEVTILGQNVNSYRDLSEITSSSVSVDSSPDMSRGFYSIYKPKKGGQRFADLLDKVSLIDTEMRIRFTSPHPKDFPDQVLQLISERPNICSQLHMPAQSGSSAILAAMRRGYTREAYIHLVQRVRNYIPDVYLSSDFISGFCGETEEDHKETVSLMRLIKYNFAFCFPYSMREKTHAYHRLKDDVPEEVKIRRHQELIAVFREEAKLLNQAQIGQIQLVLTEGVSKRSEEELQGRNDGNIKVIFPNVAIQALPNSHDTRSIRVGDYIAVQIIDGSSQVLKGNPLYHTTLHDFYRKLT